MFHDRVEAGSKLAKKLKKYQKEDGIILAVPRGGVAVAYSVAKELDFPVQLILTKKIGHPNNPEYAIGAASLNDYFIIPHELVTDVYIQDELKEIRKRLKEMNDKFMKYNKSTSITGKTVIVIDDGIATGNTLMATVSILRKSNPAKIIIAAPVASPRAVEKLRSEVDDVIVLIMPYDFYGVGGYYEEFKQVTDDEVIYYLNKLNEIKLAF